MNRFRFFILSAWLFAPLATLNAADAIPVQPPSNDHNAGFKLFAEHDASLRISGSRRMGRVIT
jgi:hypothetical protein